MPYPPITCDVRLTELDNSKSEYQASELTHAIVTRVKAIAPLTPRTSFGPPLELAWRQLGVIVMVGRLLRVTGTILVIAAALVIPALARSSPAAASNFTLGLLFGDSCTSTTFCMAVGNNNGNETLTTGTLAESWNGSFWSVVPSPSPSSSANFDSLSGVSCTSTTFCMAVGTNSHATTLIESWNASVWSVVPSPSPSSDGNSLDNVSCVSAKDCVAVGSTGGNSTTFSQTLVESWDGTTWSVTPTPTPVYNNNSFQSVSCTSSTSCMAVGETAQCVLTPVFSCGPMHQMLVESWNGTSWSIDTTPNENGTDSLASVSCSSSTSCVGLGDSLNSSTGVSEGLVDSWNGTSWTVTDGPDIGTNGGFLSSMSCLSAADCVGVGTNPNPSSGYPQTLAVSWNGTALSVVPSANPKSALAEFGGVSCVNATFCAAVGAQTQSPAQNPLFETWNGSAFSFATTPNTAVVRPSSGATVGGTSAVLDATASASAGVASVLFAVSGGAYSQTFIGTATPTIYGYVFVWNTTAVPNGAYTLQSLVTDGDGDGAYSPPVSITVNNQPPASTSVLVPSNGATLSGSTTLDASASNATSVEFLLFGGTYGYAAPVVCTATLTYYGWLCAWNTATVPNGTYALVSEASGAGGTAFSSGVKITVKN